MIIDKGMARTVLIIIGIVTIVYFLGSSEKDLCSTNSIGEKICDLQFFGSTLENVYRQPVTFERTYSIEKDSGSIVLPEGAVPENIARISMIVQSCSTRTELKIAGNTIASGSDDCSRLYYADDAGSPYTHYSLVTRGVDVAGKISSLTFPYTITKTSIGSTTFTDEGKNVVVEPVKSIIISVEELVECDRNSQCVSAAPYCNQKTHTCEPSVNSCTNEYVPVCAQNGGVLITYTNPCYATLAGASVTKEGSCNPPIISGTTPEEDTQAISPTVPEDAGDVNTTRNRIIGIASFIAIIGLIAYVAGWIKFGKK